MENDCEFGNLRNPDQSLLSSLPKDILVKLIMTMHSIVTEPLLREKKELEDALYFNAFQAGCEKCNYPRGKCDLTLIQLANQEYTTICGECVAAGYDLEGGEFKNANRITLSKR